MTRSDKDGWFGVAAAVVLVITGLAAYVFSDIDVGLFAAGVGAMGAPLTYAAMRQRRYWNKLYGRDLWDETDT
jgi:hypothetical protein